MEINQFEDHKPNCFMLNSPYHEFDFDICWYFTVIGMV